MNVIFDIAVIGGGNMGCGAAIRLAEGGMRTIILEQGDIGQGASGVNAGTLSLQIKRVKLMPYAIKGHEEWQNMGAEVGFHKTGGYTLAFNDREAELLYERMTLKKEAGANISFVSDKELIEKEPALARKVVAASYCGDDGYANSLLSGQYYRKKIKQSGISFLEKFKVIQIRENSDGFEISSGGQTVVAKRLLLACGGWMKDIAAMIGADLPINARINTVSVTERAPRLLNSIIGHATGLLTMKQKENGTVLIGGGWQGKGTPEQGRGNVSLETLIPNLQLAKFALPKLSKIRIVRSWTGFEANVPDFYPLAGRLANKENVFVLGCVRGGYTIGPYISKLMGDYILGRQPEMPLFDPSRDFK
ncbi:MAG: FAD-binding oxidoreductase [Kordiimonadaceae bacterium]|jgi:sarcosine oxidase, subunit beta|nr:FAD-binding oxidoreductase [Kordiimonadaceae bacterium]MBT6036529.1 FAD-binding oxidoreductase [Kordiimonadaceae bacterium]MBT6328581.1 FAD-binding oxidoreductase [Kordiimonadaceae bacterium]MBT7582363.1 FAD-binding oxidoreductase [Kordiimonadaceae bacterium]